MKYDGLAKMSTKKCYKLEKILLISSLSIKQVPSKTMNKMLSNAWDYRFFIFSAIRSEFRSRFARSRIGGLWLLLQPLAQVAIYALILSSVLSSRLPGSNSKYIYATYLMAGMMAWSLFAEIVTRCLTVFVDHGSTMKKIVFPRICLPLIVTGVALINNFLLFLAMYFVFLLLGQAPGIFVFWLPILVALTIALSVGLGLILGILNVFIRDTAQILIVVLQLWFWFTPVVYMSSVIPENYRHFLKYNPMSPIISSYQNVLVFSQPPTIELSWVLGLAIVLIAIAVFMFRKAAVEMVDVL